MIVVIGGAYTMREKPDPNKTPDIIYKNISVYFPNKDKYNVGTEPYEESVERKTEITTGSMQAVLKELYLGPSQAEKDRGLFMTYNHTTGATITFEPETGVAKIYLKGECNSDGASYTIGSIIAKNIRQFPEVKYVRIYDPEGKTQAPEKPLSSSSPACLEP